MKCNHGFLRKKFIFCFKHEKCASFSLFQGVKMAYFQPARTFANAQYYFQPDQRVKMWRRRARAAKYDNITLSSCQHYALKNVQL